MPRYYLGDGMYINCSEEFHKDLVDSFKNWSWTDMYDICDKTHGKLKEATDAIQHLHHEAKEGEDRINDVIRVGFGPEGAFGITYDMLNESKGNKDQNILDYRNAIYGTNLYADGYFECNRGHSGPELRNCDCWMRAATKLVRDRDKQLKKEQQRDQS